MVPTSLPRAWVWSLDSNMISVLADCKLEPMQAWLEVCMPEVTVETGGTKETNHCYSIEKKTIIQMKNKRKGNSGQTRKKVRNRRTEDKISRSVLELALYRFELVLHSIQDNFRQNYLYMKKYQQKMLYMFVLEVFAGVCRLVEV